MKKYKYYYKSDPKKETVGIVEAITPLEAYNRAIEKKQLSFLEFDKLFNVEEIDEREN